MHDLRIALIYDAALRPETTGIYCLRALAKLVTRVEHIRPEQLVQLRPGKFDLYLAIDDGLDYPLPAALQPLAYWAIDTHLNLPRSLARAAEVQFLFAAQQNGAAALQEHGFHHAIWLPLACDPELHAPWSVEKSYDLAFVGNLFPGPRSDLVHLLQRHFQKMFVGRAYFEEMARIYSSARVAFNRSIRDDVNMRVFEVLGCGTFLLTNSLATNGQESLLRDGVHLATYGDAEELLDKVRYYLSHEDLRNRIARCGREEVLTRHTYQHRLETIIQTMQSNITRTTSRVEASSAITSPDPGYYGHARPEILALIPDDAKRVLDIGCGHGQLGAALKSRQTVEVVGIELDTRAANVAREQLDLVHEGDIEKLELDYSTQRFDVIVCGDVLEHLQHPETLLRRIRAWLAPTGRLVASVPNVRHHSVVAALLRGDWTYESAGLLDQTHLRFFTRRELEKLCFRSGFEVSSLTAVNVPDGLSVDIVGESPRANMGPYSVSGLTHQDIDEMSVYQYLLVARPQLNLTSSGQVMEMLPPEAFPLTSIVIVTCNELHYTRLCLQSIWLRTDEDYELIVVDNGSTDGTVEYLRSMPNVTLIENSQNRGFPAAANQGLRAARGTQILLLNNDCIVSTGWLRRLLMAFRSSSDVGLVGPTSNYVSGRQQIPVGYDSLQGLDGWAWQWGQQHAGKCEEVDRLVGFCLLIRREVIEAIGELDERFGIGNYEDDDYCRRALTAGFRAIITRDAFVHHFGGRTFLGTGIDFAGLLRENERLYREKWSAPELVPTPGGTMPLSFALAAGGGLLLPRTGEVHLSLCMIVRDSARTLPAALESVRPWVDEMIVVDTGSQDDTPAIARQFGARVFHFPWCDDFAAARNESLKHARGKWLFWMDSDDTIDRDNGHRLKELVRRPAPPERLGYVVQVHCPGHLDGCARDLTVVDHVKVFRNRPDLRFEGRIHEQILPAIRRAAGEVEWTDLYVVHSGADLSAAGEGRKLARDLRLLELELAEHPDHPFALFNLGMTYAAMGQHDRAITSLEHASRVSHANDSHVRKIFALWISSLMQLTRHQEAWEVCQQGRVRLPDDPELSFREGMLAHHFGWLRQAERAYREALRERQERHFSSIDPGIYGYKARHNLAMVYVDLDEPAQAEAEWRLVLASMPDYREGWRGLGDALLRQGKHEELEANAVNLAAHPHLAAEGRLLLAQLARARGEFVKARNHAQQATVDSATMLAAQRFLSHLLFDHGEPQEAREALDRLLSLDSSDPAIHFNRGLLALRMDAPHEAVAPLQESLRLRPNAPHAHLYLGIALNRMGRRNEAQRALEQAQRLAPNDDDVRSALEKLGTN